MHACVRVDHVTNLAWKQKKLNSCEGLGQAARQMVDKALDSTAKVLAGLAQHSSKDSGPSKGFQALIKSIGESKTKHVRLSYSKP